MRTLRIGADPAELRLLLPLARRFTSKTEVVSGLDERVWVQGWLDRLRTGRAAIFVRRNANGRILTAAIGGILYRNPNDGVLEAKEAFWISDPRYPRHGIGLLTTFENWAQVAGARRFWLVRLEGEGAEVLDRLYERRGYRRQEVAFCREIE